MGPSPDSKVGFRSKLRKYAARSALMLAAAGLIGYGGGLGLSRWFSSAAPPPNTIDVPRLTVSESDLQLGKIDEAPVYDHAIPLTNRSTHPVTIARFYASCNCLGIVPPGPVTLQPGESRTLTIKLRPPSWHFSAKDQEGVPVQVEFGAACPTNDGNRNVTWRLNYTVVPTIWLMSPILRLGEQSELQTGIQKTGLIEASTHVTRIEAVAPPQWSVKIAPAPMMAGLHQYEIVVQYHGPYVPQPISETIRLVPIGPDGTRLPPKELKVVGAVVHDMAATPPEIHHGPQTCGKTIEEAVRISSRTGRPFRVVSVRGAAPDLTVTRLPGADEVYSFRQRITTPGDQVAQATFVVRDAVGAEYEVPVPFRYRGLAAPNQ